MNFITVPLAVADEVGVQLRVLLTEIQSFFQSHYHEGRSVGIGCGAILGQYGGREDVMLDGCAK